MSTAAPPPPAPAQAPARQKEITIYSHSTLFYWWPVWVGGFIMALVTAFSGEVLAVVPAHTKPDVNRKLPWLASEDAKSKDEGIRNILVLPKGKEHPKNKTTGDLEEPHLRIAYSKNVGVLFCTILLLVVFITNVPLRGLWSVIVIGTIIFVSIIFAILDWWDPILTYLSFLDIRINMGGYLFISIVLFVLWCIVTFLFDKQIYMIFAPGQFRVRLEIGEGETAYDTAGMTIQKQRSDLFRHMILGFGSGDLIVRTSGAQAHTFDLPNVLALGRRVREIEDMLRTRAVVAGGRDV
ncbi:MAG TPA: hypothetical protein VKE98_22345 [Gemmataceae bacterium]|nr:hypothetical protein [Gemmataceae bacterium]